MTEKKKSDCGYATFSFITYSQSPGPEILDLGVEDQREGVTGTYGKEGFSRRELPDSGPN